MSAIDYRPDGKIVITLRITLDPRRDADIITALTQAPPRRRASYARELMRSGVGGHPTALEEDVDDMPLELSGMSYEL